MCWEGADLIGSPQKFLYGGADLRQKEGDLSAVTRHLEVGKVVTGTVLRAVSEFMIYYKLLHPLRPGVTIPPH